MLTLHGTITEYFRELWHIVGDDNIKYYVLLLFFAKLNWITYTQADNWSAMCHLWLEHGYYYIPGMRAQTVICSPDWAKGSQRVWVIRFRSVKVSGAMDINYKQTYV